MGGVDRSLSGGWWYGGEEKWVGTEGRIGCGRRARIRIRKMEKIRTILLLFPRPKTQSL